MLLFSLLCTGVERKYVNCILYCVFNLVAYDDWVFNDMIAYYYVMIHFVSITIKTSSFGIESFWCLIVGLPPIKKDFYTEQKEVTSMSPVDIQKFRFVCKYSILVIVTAIISEKRITKYRFWIYLKKPGPFRILLEHFLKHLVHIVRYVVLYVKGCLSLSFSELLVCCSSLTCGPEMFLLLLYFCSWYFARACKGEIYKTNTNSSVFHVPYICVLNEVICGLIFLVPSMAYPVARLRYDWNRTGIIL